MATVTSQAL